MQASPDTQSHAHSKLRAHERISKENMALNVQRNTSYRTIVAIVAGAFAGMFGFTGLQGVAVYLVFMALATVLSLAKMNFKVEDYYTGMVQFALSDLVSCFFTYVLFWTLFYDIVQVYSS